MMDINTPGMRRALAKIIRMAKSGSITEKEAMVMVKKTHDTIKPSPSEDKKKQGSIAHAEAMKKKRATLAAAVMRRAMKRAKK
jgi:hypothetical protein